MQVNFTVALEINFIFMGDSLFPYSVAKRPDLCTGLSSRETFYIYEWIKRLSDGASSQKHNS
jgi:hypothetical protein